MSIPSLVLSKSIPSEDPMETPAERRIKREDLVDIAPDREDFLLEAASIDHIREALKIRTHNREYVCSTALVLDLPKLRLFRIAIGCSKLVRVPTLGYGNPSSVSLISTLSLNRSLPLLIFETVAPCPSPN